MLQATEYYTIASYVVRRELVIIKLVFPVSKVISEKVCKILLPLRLGVPQAGGAFVVFTFICHFT